MAASGRYLNFRVRIPDRPGALAQLLAELAAMDANVLDVVHERTKAQLHIHEVEVALQLETRGAEHRSRILSALRKARYPLSIEWYPCHIEKLDGLAIPHHLAHD